MKWLILSLMFLACDTDNGPVTCRRHEVMCNDTCVFIDEVLLYNLECIETKRD